MGSAWPSLTARKTDSTWQQAGALGPSAPDLRGDSLQNVVLERNAFRITFGKPPLRLMGTSLTVRPKDLIDDQRCAPRAHLMRNGPQKFVGQHMAAGVVGIVD